MRAAGAWAVAACVLLGLALSLARWGAGAAAPPAAPRAQPSDASPAAAPRLALPEAARAPSLPVESTQREPSTLDAAPTTGVAEPAQHALLEVRGRVVDEAGVGIAGLQVLRWPTKEKSLAVAISAQHGWFVAQGLAPGEVLYAEGPSWACTHAYKVREGGEATIRCERTSLVRGIVLDERGAPVEGAAVLADLDPAQLMAGASRAAALWTRHAVSDAGGRFEIALAEAPRTLRVLVEGEERLERALAPPLPGFLELRLTPVADGTIAGHLLEGGVAPLAGWRVMALPRSEELPRGTPRGDDAPRIFRSGDDGRFRLEGLPASLFDVLAVDERSAREAWARGVRPGSDEVLLVPPASGLERLRGRVLAADGTPLARVRVRAVASAAVGTAELCMNEVLTGSDGGFEFHEPLALDATLSFDGERVVEARRPIAEGELARDGRRLYVLGRLCALRVHRARGADVDALELRDAAGKPLTVHLRGANVRLSMLRVPLTGDGPHELLAPEGAVSVAVLRGAQVQRVLPLALDPAAAIELVVGSP